MTKHPLLFVALLSLLSVVAALIILHFSPGEQGGQLEGVAITQVSVLEEDGGEIPLSDGLSRRLVTLLRQYDRLSYSALPSYTPQPGDLLLTDDRAPVELLGMRVLDELIDGQLSYYKEQFSMEEIINMVT